MSTQADPSEKRFGRIRRSLAGSGRALGFMLFVVGAGVVWMNLSDPYASFDLPAGRLLLAAALIGGGILLLRDDPAVRSEADVQTRAPRVRRSRSPLTLFTLALAFIAVGAAIVLGNLSILTLSIGQLSALSLIVVGMGLVVGAWWGRARWLIVMGLLLVPPVMITSYVDMPPRGQIGSIHLRPRSQSELAGKYNLMFGTMQIDLTGLKRVSGTEFVNVNVAAGNLTVYVPERVSLRVAGHIEWGNATLGRGYEDGEDLSFSKVFEGKPGAGTLDLDVNGGIASLYVERISRRERMGPPADRGAHRRGDGKGRDARGGDARARGDRPGRDRGPEKLQRPGDRRGRGNGRG